MSKDDLFSTVFERALDRVPELHEHNARETSYIPASQVLLDPTFANGRPRDQLHELVDDMGRWNRFLFTVSQRYAFRAAATRLSEAMMDCSVDLAVQKLEMTADIIKAQTLLEYLKHKPELAKSMLQLSNDYKLSAATVLCDCRDRTYDWARLREKQINENLAVGRISEEAVKTERAIASDICREELADGFTQFRDVFRQFYGHLRHTLGNVIREVPPSVYRTKSRSS